MEAIEISSIEVRSMEDEDKVLIHGPLEFRNRQLLCELALSSLEKRKPVILDMSDVSFVDSEGIGSLVQLIKCARDLAVPVYIDGVSLLLTKLFRLTGLMKFFKHDKNGRVSVKLDAIWRLTQP